MQLAIGDTLCRKIQIGVASRNRRKFCRKTLWAHFPAIYKIRHCFQHTFYPALTAIISQWSLVTENKCLASTRTIADFARMPEISGVPADTPLLKQSVLAVCHHGQHLTTIPFNRAALLRLDPKQVYWDLG